MKTFESRKNHVALLKSGVIRKTFTERGAYDNEVRLLSKLDGVLAPRLLTRGGNFLDIAFVEGNLLIDEYLAADTKKAELLAASLAKTVDYIYRTAGEITFDENFRNYIVTDKSCIRIDFEETTAGSIESYIAKIMAFATLYEVADEVKLIFIRTLAQKTHADILALVAEYEKEVRFLSDRWKTAFPRELCDKIIRCLVAKKFTRYIIGIDDTDDMESKGTGEIASELIKIIETMGYGKCGYITRHQLLIHPDIKYTSHNSSMVFEALCDSARAIEMKSMLCAHVKKESSPLSDPGLCIFCPDDTGDCTELLKFGYLAKNKVLAKESALSLAEKHNVFLTELGGDGSGVIGALAGAMLRYGRNDGELKGGAKNFRSESTYKISDLLASEFIDDVKTVDGTKPLPKDRVYVTWKIKPVLTDGRLTVFLKHTADGFFALEKNEMRDLEKLRADITPCSNFIPDVDEERVSAANFTCLNCTFRRWTKNSFTCEYKK